MIKLIKSYYPQRYPDPKGSADYDTANLKITEMKKVV